VGRLGSTRWVAGGEGFCFVKVVGGGGRRGRWNGPEAGFAEGGSVDLRSLGMKRRRRRQRRGWVWAMEIEERSFVAALLWMTAKCG